MLSLPKFVATVIAGVITGLSLLAFAPNWVVMPL